MDKAKVLITKCPVCEGDIEIPSDAIHGEIVSCPDCGTMFEVGTINEEGVVLKKVEVQGEDWGE
ncbi:MAG: lysine biosynthesis protein LysW [Candidatus Brockarchaeota archaeon]|nr:lysine biosynthesis protein LysW [Candidatus Brockarchaeota archaeon]